MLNLIEESNIQPENTKSNPKTLNLSFIIKGLII